MPVIPCRGTSSLRCHRPSRSNDGGALAGLDVEHVIATGQSQSAGRLANYYNTIHPIYDYFDGFVYHDRASRLRDDVHTPAVTVDSDALDSLGIRPTWPSGPWTRVWNSRAALTLPSGVANTWIWCSTAIRHCSAMGCRSRSPNGSSRRVPWWTRATGGQFGPVDTGVVLNAAFESVQNWIRTGEPAPASIYYERDAMGAPIRNAQHISSGGIRLPELVAPTVFFDAWNGPPYRFPCAVGGYTIDYTAAELKDIYGSHGKYVS